MEAFPFRIAGIASRLGKIVPIAEWAEQIRVPNHKRRGAILEGEDITRILGIESKSWDPELFSDFNVIAQTTAAAIESAGYGPRDIDLVVLLSCTPYEIMLDQDAFRLLRLLGFDDSIVPLQLQAGCAGLLRAASLAARMNARRVLVVSYNVPSLFMLSDGAPHPHYLRNDAHPNAAGLWASPAIFSDAAAAVVLERSESRASHYLYSRDSRRFGNGPAFEGPLVTYKGGGAWHPPGSTHATELSAYAMNGQEIKEYYIKGMLHNHAAMQVARPQYLEQVARLYVHQANRDLIDAFLAIAEIPAELVPSRVATYGNLVSASTLRLLHEDLAQRRVCRGDEIALSVVGAGPERGALFCRVNVQNVPPL